MNKRIFYSEYFYQKGSKDTGVLERNANEYPYSSLASFLLLYHYKKSSDPAFGKFAKKTALLFNNPHWLQFQLFDESAANSGEIISDENLHEENLLTTNQDNEIPVEPSFIENVNEESVAGSEESTFQIPGVEEVKEINGETFVVSSNEETLHQESESQENLEENVLSNSFQKNEFTENETAINETLVTEPAVAENVKTENENTANETGITAFEPLHTVDYFASQGIKITEELLTKDKLGSQMKSFTAWLKSMKKLHPGKLEEQSLATEKLVQASANESNFNTEILTEAMAEVLIKQDKKEKAIEMFSKLSLINPSKSAYFAARIESIKSH